MVFGGALLWERGGATEQGDAYTVQLAYTNKQQYKQQAAKCLGMDAATVASNLQQLQRLLPSLTPDLFKMKAIDWVRVWLHYVYGYCVCGYTIASQ